MKIRNILLELTLMKLRNLLLVLAFMTSLLTSGQTADSLYTSENRPTSLWLATKAATKAQRVTFWDSSIGEASMVSVPLVGASLLVQHEDKNFFDHRSDYLPAHKKREYYLQYASAVTLLSMKIAGVKSESSWAQMLTADAFAVAFMGGAVELFKHTSDVWRPDGSDDHSYPSGHTATAFMTATMLHHEYGARYPWLSVMGYATATATGYMRIAQNRHSLSDVMAGAGIGIMATELGYLASDLIFHKPVFRDSDYFDGLDYGSERPSFLGYYAGFNVPLRSFDIAQGVSVRTSSGCTLGVEGAWFFMPHLGVGARASYTDMRFYAADIAQTPSLEWAMAQAGLYYSWRLSGRFSVGIKALCGYGHFRGVDAVIDSSGGICHLPSTSGITDTYGVSIDMHPSRNLTYRLFVERTDMPLRTLKHHHESMLNIGLQMAYHFK